MEWLSQCVSLVKDSLPPGTLIISATTQSNALKAPKRGRHATMARLQLDEGVESEEVDEFGNGKRRKVHHQQERTTLNRSPKKYKHTSHPPSASAAAGEGTTPARPPQNAWFHPSHPLREDPRVTARRYNAGYDLEEDLQTRAETASVNQRTMTMQSESSLTGGGGLENGAASRRLKITGKGLVDKPASPSLSSSFPSSAKETDTGTGVSGIGNVTGEQQVNYDRVFFAEQVLQPVYHSPYPSIKLPTSFSNHEGGTHGDPVIGSSTSSRRRATIGREPGIHHRTTSTRVEQTLRQDGRDDRRTNVNASVDDKADQQSTAAASRVAVSHDGQVALMTSSNAAPGNISSRDQTNGRATTSINDASARNGQDSSVHLTGERSRLKRNRGASREPRKLRKTGAYYDDDRSEEEEDDEEEDFDDDEEHAGSEKQEEKDDDYAPPDTSSSIIAPLNTSTRHHPHTNNPAARHQHVVADRSSFSATANGNANGRPFQTQQRSLWVCDRCFKYMPIESAYVAHTKTCTVNFPPGRKVYERANWGIWEIDGRVDKLYCQNLSLFGKLFIDHKSICFDVESFYYYVLTDSSPKRDHVIAYFTKEKFSIDDFNLATILVFPHVQQSGFGRLLMEFSYHLTKNSPTPGTPERPLSLLGARSYESLWMAMLVRHLIKRLFDQGDKKAPRARGGGKIKKVDTYMRVWERRKAVVQRAIEADDYLNYDDLKATLEELERQEEQLPLLVTVTVEQLAKECNLKTDDLLCLLDALGVLEQRKMTRPPSAQPDQDTVDSRARRATHALAKQLGLQEWSTMQVCIDFELIVKIVGTWRIPAKPLLDPQCCWIEHTGGPLNKPVVAASRKNYVGY